MSNNASDFCEIKKSIESLVKQQLNILRFNNCKDLTLSIPKPVGFTEDLIKSIVLESMTNNYEVIFSQSFLCNSTNSVILITLKKL